MRMAGVVTLGVLLIEAVIGGAFALGVYWPGGLHWALLFSGAMLLLILLPWLGELKVAFDSAGPKGGMKIGWWGRVSFIQRADVGHVTVRILGIPIRRRIEKEKDPTVTGADQELEQSTEFEPPAEKAPSETSDEKPKHTSQPKPWWKRIDSDTVEGFCRVIGSALGGTCELVWGAEELRVSVQDPAEQTTADTALEQIFGRRQVGPLDLTLTNGPGERRIRAVYRISLVRAVLAGVQIAVDGRMREFVRRMKRQKQESDMIDEDERIVEQIMQQDKLDEEDED